MASFCFAIHPKVVLSPRMATRFFRHLGTDPVRLADGRLVHFKSADGLQSFMATPDPSLWSEFERCMKEGRSGLTEVSWAEFDSQYLQKKSNSPQLKQPWREEIGRMMPSDSVLQSRLQALPAADVANPASPSPPPVAPPAAMSQPAINAQIAKEIPKVEDYKPEVGKRRKAKVA